MKESKSGEQADMKLNDTDRELLSSISKLLWSIGDALSEMDYTRKNTWDRIGETAEKAEHLANQLSQNQEIQGIRSRVLKKSSLYIFWSSLVDEIEILLKRPVS